MQEIATMTTKEIAALMAKEEQDGPEAQPLPPEQIIARFRYDHSRAAQYRISLNFAELKKLLPDQLRSTVHYFGVALSNFRFGFDILPPSFDIPASFIPEVIEEDLEHRVQDLINRLNEIPETIRAPIITLADEALRDVNEATKLVWEHVKIGHGENGKSIYQTAKVKAKEQLYASVAAGIEQLQLGVLTTQAEQRFDVTNQPDAKARSRAWHVANAVITTLTPDEIFIP